MDVPDCPYHVDHSNRLKRLEDDVDEIKRTQKSPALTVAIISLLGTLMASGASIITTLVLAWGKSRGWL